jgi:RNA polymerase sigma-70 factor (ECF subfamily)
MDGAACPLDPRPSDRGLVRVTMNADAGDRSRAGPGRAPVPPAERGTDDALILRVQQGDQEAFDALVRRYLQRAYAVAHRVSGNREDAEDLVQESFMAALRHIGSFELGRPFLPWLCTIIVNRGISLQRSWAVRTAEELPDTLATHEPSPLSAALNAEMLDRVRRTLATLPERQALAIELHDVEGFSAAEIAGMLDVAAGTVRWYIHQGRQALRAALAPWHDREEGDDDAE